MRRNVVVLCVALILTMLSSAALGQSATASLRGVVTDATKAVVPGAEVVNTSVGTAQRHIERTDNNGEFSFVLSEVIRWSSTSGWVPASTTSRWTSGGRPRARSSILP